MVRYRHCVALHMYYYYRLALLQRDRTGNSHVFPFGILEVEATVLLLISVAIKYCNVRAFRKVLG